MMMNLVSSSLALLLLVATCSIGDVAAVEGGLLPPDYRVVSYEITAIAANLPKKRRRRVLADSSIYLGIVEKINPGITTALAGASYSTNLRRSLEGSCLNRRGLNKVLGPNNRYLPVRSCPKKCKHTLPYNIALFLLLLILVVALVMRGSSHTVLFRSLSKISFQARGGEGSGRFVSNSDADAGVDRVGGDSSG